MPMRFPNDPKDSVVYLRGYCDGKLDYEAKHGKWIGHWIDVENNIDYYPFMCSECYETVIKKTNYCPRCGAKMDNLTR